MRILFLLSLAVCLFACGPAAEPDATTDPDEGWVSLFNGQDLSGWTPKFTGSAYGENYKNTFRVADGHIQVAYTEYDSFRNEFGHLFYEKELSDYHLRLEYRFSGEQSAGGPDWAWRNSGVMFHCQEPGTMTIDQAFPICLEYQMLGGDTTGERATGNLCTPSTHVYMADTLHTQHCTDSSSPTYRGDDWVKAELIVYHDSLIYHLINGDTVMTYTRPIIGDESLPADSPYRQGAPVRKGYIALQAESHPVEFRNIELRELER